MGFGFGKMMAGMRPEGMPTFKDMSWAQRLDGLSAATSSDPSRMGQFAGQFTPPSAQAGAQPGGVPMLQPQQQPPQDAPMQDPANNPELAAMMQRLAQAGGASQPGRELPRRGFGFGRR